MMFALAVSISVSLTILPRPQPAPIYTCTRVLVEAGQYEDVCTLTY